MTCISWLQEQGCMNTVQKVRGHSRNASILLTSWTLLRNRADLAWFCAKLWSVHFTVMSWLNVWYFMMVWITGLRLVPIDTNVMNIMRLEIIKKHQECIEYVVDLVYYIYEKGMLLVLCEHNVLCFVHVTCVWNASLSPVHSKFLPVHYTFWPWLPDPSKARFPWQQLPYST